MDHSDHDDGGKDGSLFRISAYLVTASKRVTASKKVGQALQELALACCYAKELVSALETVGAASTSRVELLATGYLKIT